MTKTDWIFSEADHSLHQEFCAQDSVLNPVDNTNPAELIIDYPASFNVTRGLTGDESFSQSSVDIPSDVMDKMAIAWCKKRGLHGALGGPVGREFGSADCEYDDQVSHSIEQEDAEMVKLVKDREGQPEIVANLEFDNIFEVVANSAEEAKRLQEESDEFIKDRDVKELTGVFSKLSPQRKRAAFYILNHIRANQNIDDETSLLSAIQEALLAGHIMSADEHVLDSAWLFEDRLAAGTYAPGLNENGKWLLVGTDSHKEILITALAPLSVKIVERLIQQSKLISAQSPQWVTPQLRLTMYRCKN
jgi:hypothetical protein